MCTLEIVLLSLIQVSWPTTYIWCTQYASILLLMIYHLNIIRYHPPISFWYAELCLILLLSCFQQGLPSIRIKVQPDSIASKFLIEAQTNRPKFLQAQYKTEFQSSTSLIQCPFIYFNNKIFQFKTTEPPWFPLSDYHRWWVNDFQWQPINFKHDQVYSLLCQNPAQHLNLFYERHGISNCGA